MSEPDFQDRMFLGGEAVYAAIERGNYTSPQQVEAALMDAHLEASTEEDD